LLLFYADRVAHLLLPRELQPADAGPVRSGEMQSVAFSVVGLVFVARALPKLIAVVLSRNGFPSYLPDRSSGLHYDLYETVGEFLFGLILFFRGNGLRALLERVRTPR
jgi:hypothetical protein